MLKSLNNIRVWSNGSMHYPVAFSINHSFNATATLTFSLNGTRLEVKEFMLPIFETPTADPFRPEITYEQDILLCKTHYNGPLHYVAGVASCDDQRFAVMVTTAAGDYIPLFACEVVDNLGNTYENPDALAKGTTIADQKNADLATSESAASCPQPQAMFSPNKAVSSEQRRVPASISKEKPISSGHAAPNVVNVPDNFASNNSEKWFEQGFDPEAVNVFTNGACIGNPGPAGAAYFIQSRDFFYHHAEVLIHSKDKPKTNNIAELTSVCMALSQLPFGCAVTVYSNSKYVVDAHNQGWLSKWQKNDWLNSSGTPVANDDLWKRLLELETAHDINWVWGKDHAGNKNCTICDSLAVSAAKKAQRLSGRIDQEERAC